MSQRYHPAAALAACLLIFALAWSSPALAAPSAFDTNCASCHSDDTRTCDGCHAHMGTISASADLAEYAPGEEVFVTLEGGGAGGWIRGLLYDDLANELDRASGPTGTGDDGEGDPVEFPVILTATAPMEPGEYTWEAAWLGGETDGSGHLQETTEVVIRVTSTPVRASTWSIIKMLY
jgi:hypothetical protein